MLKKYLIVSLVFYGFCISASIAMQNIDEPRGINIIRKALVNRELKEQFNSRIAKKQKPHLDTAQTFSESVKSSKKSDPIDDWVNLHTPTWVEKMDDPLYRWHLHKCFDTYVLNHIVNKMRDRVQAVVDKEKENKDYFSLCHGSGPQYGFVYTVQSIFKDFLDMAPSNGVWNFRWDHDRDERKASCVNDLIVEVQESPQKDESGFYRKNALCAVPSIYTNFLTNYESAAQLWFTSKSVCNQQAGSVGSHVEFIWDILGSLGFENELRFEMRNAFTQEAYKLYPKDGRLFQIFIHPDVVKEMVYLSASFGRPCQFQIEDRKINDVGSILEAYRNNESVQAKACAQGVEFPVEIGKVQARILFKPEYFRNPNFVMIQDHFINEEDARPLLKQCEQKIEEALIKYLPKWLDTNPDSQNDYPLLRLKKYVHEGTALRSF